MPALIKEKPSALSEALYNHLVFPPSLPHYEESNLDAVQIEVIDHLVKAAARLRDLPGNDPEFAWAAVCRSLIASKRINSSGHVDRSALARELRVLSDADFIVVYVRCQNCALYIRRETDASFGQEVVFEAFETSARNEDIMATKNALLWDFPGTSVAVPLSTVLKDGFIHNIATFLEHASREPVKNFSAHTFKAGATVYEYRDTPEPALVSSFLTAILEENGRKVSPCLLRKKVRDDVLWRDASKPWRRLPYWLVLRVSVSRFLAQRLGGVVGRFEYKFLIADMLAGLVDNFRGSCISVERLDLLKKKICRRLFKLETDKSQLDDPEIVSWVEGKYKALDPRYKDAVLRATRLIEAEWGRQKLSMSVVIPPLPLRASKQDLCLDLRVSYNLLQGIRHGFNRPRPRIRQEEMSSSADLAAVAKKHLNHFYLAHSVAMDLEETAGTFLFETRKLEPDELCEEASGMISRYLKASLHTYTNMPEQRSLMLLCAMELWQKMDEAACTLFPLLKEYHPVFHPHMLDVLRIPTFKEMKRAQVIQNYLRDRINSSNHAKLNIFSDPTRGCFAYRWFEESEDSPRLQRLHLEIESWALEARDRKAEEWKLKSEDYARLSKSIDQSSCVYEVDDDNPLSRGIHYRTHCPRCKMMQQQSQIKIQAYEHPLPADPIFAKTVVFELALPAAFATYRETTWNLVFSLANPQREAGIKPKFFLKDYQQLKRFSANTPTGFSLASTTKPFLTTHYSFMNFPVEWESGRDGVCRPNALRLAYFDAQTHSWPARVRSSPTFTHHVKLEIPKSLPFSSLTEDPMFAEKIYGPSSYEIMATSMKCPQGLNIHEYLAFQTVASGASRRWLAILTELGSANLNFSNEATTLILNHLISQLGPLGDNQDSLRLMHSIFRDEGFVFKLIDQLQQRLDTLLANWREASLMETIITIAIRIIELTSPDAANLEEVMTKAQTLLSQARIACAEWFRTLRVDTRMVRDATDAQRCQQYALWAALLCKKTFQCHVSGLEDFDASTMELYIMSSITVQDNLVVKLEVLPRPLQVAITKDLRMSYTLRDDVANFITRHPDVFRKSLKEIWPGEAQGQRQFSSLKVEYRGWLSCKSLSSSLENDTTQQTVFYNYIEGILLVDGRTVGKLPKDPAKTFLLNELFPDQALLTFPSDRNGMEHLLCLRPSGYRVHVGYDSQGEIIVRAFNRHYSLQLIPRDKFRRGNNSDLPGPLLDRHFHWLNLKDGLVFITQLEKPWPGGPDFFGYAIDIDHLICSRPRPYAKYGTQTRQHVVSPYSPLFVRTARILAPFEASQEILVTQPPGRKNLQVELRRLHILFFVNDKNLLFSPQLQCEIDPDQDAGTLYGLRNKLVCRQQDNPTQRSILIPFGEITVDPHGSHVAMRIKPDGRYGKYVINTTLGRLDCAAEPALIYMKALMHACTSFVIVDPLTGRTGAEEAIQWLESGICQPWTPLPPSAIQRLELIAKLTPKREFYPTDLRVMRTDHWSDFAPVTLQSSRYRPIVEQILKISESLQTFCQNENSAAKLPSVGDSHLHLRATARQAPFQRSLRGVRVHSMPMNQSYQPRDRMLVANTRHRNVLEVTSLLRQWPQNIKTTSQLSQLFSSASKVVGFGCMFDKPSLNDRLNVDVVQEWGRLVTFACRTTDRFALMFLFGLMSFRADIDMSLIRTLISFAIFEDLRDMMFPPWEDYLHFKQDQSPQLDYLLRLLKPFQSQRQQDDKDCLEQFASAKQRKKLLIERSKHEALVDADSRFFANTLLNQWPCVVPKVESLLHSSILDVSSAMEVIAPEWERLYRNADLAKHFRKVQEILNRHTSESTYEPSQPPLFTETFPLRTFDVELVHIGDLLRKPTLSDVGMEMPSEPSMKARWDESTPEDARRSSHKKDQTKRPTITLPSMTYNRSNQQASRNSNAAQGVLIHELGQIVGKLSGSKSLVRRRYGHDFQQSLKALRKTEPPTNLMHGGMRKRDKEIEELATCVRDQFATLESSFDQPSPSCSSRQIRLLKTGGLWPSVTKREVLECLSSNSRKGQQFGSGTFEAMLQLGVQITKLQRQVRLHNMALKDEEGRYLGEELNRGHTNWKPKDYPDWLLLEIESNMMIRPVQVDVALATIDPQSHSNSVLQMNMGQGKTSCIIPMVVATLADGKRLVRTLVPKALLLQTAQLLQTRLGGLLGRQLRHVPFSRRTPTSEKNIELYFRIHKDMLKSGGVMMCQPEHNMSFMLSGRQRLLDGQLSEAGPMIRVGSWLSKMSRDIMDESDYTLAVRTQLIYPSGSQMTVDGHPHRWQVSEAVLRLVNIHVFNLSREFPNSIDVIKRSGGGFPLIYFLRQDAEDELARRLTSDICQGRGGILPMNTNALQRDDRTAIKDFISSAKPRPKTLDRVRRLCPDRPHIRQTVYLLRGLLVNRILLMTLKKLWNVEYGLHPNRDPIAVPFHAKGVPSEQSEWGHPDVAILFTCLAFYYDGINRFQLRQCLDHVLKSDDPSIEYDAWIQSTDSFPSSLKAWNSINADDETQVGEIWKIVRYNEVVINYFLNNFVFPRHAKQFKVKLQSNGWDIPLFSVSDDFVNSKTDSKPLTTGFSGTNDNRTMLPLNVEQGDLPRLLHTNAEVLVYLLQQRNRHCVLPRDLLKGSRVKRATERDLLHGLKQRNIRVLIDAGAQILEMDNVTLAREWLKIDTQALAALYFDENNKAWILTKQDISTPLLASPFVDDLSRCLVYLDEAHTRGTDLRLPPKATGALTLRLGQTKDHTVQAAMRLRQLGTTQSVNFFIPPEVHQSISDLMGKTVHDTIDSSDIIEWLLDNTCEGIEQLQPLYYSQGLDFCRRTQAALESPDFLKDKTQRAGFVEKIKQDEQQILQQLYEPKTKIKPPGAHESSNPTVSRFLKELNKRRRAFQDTGRAVHASALQEVEQEREVEFEVESVRQVKKPVQHAAHAFPGLHPGIEAFVRSGRIVADADCFIHVMYALASTGIGRKFRISRAATDSKLFLSAQFNKTVKLSIDLTIDNFIRPVNWVLWSPLTETAVVIIPEEAEALIPTLLNPASSVKAHLLLYAAPITRKMMHFNDLNFHSIPPLPPQWVAPEWLRVELGVFSGRLYFDWSEYGPLCDLLGIKEGVALEDEARELMVLDGADECCSDEENEETTSMGEKPQGLVSKPLSFIQEWLAVRRRGQEFEHSPMGFVSQGRSLLPDHAFFSKEDPSRKMHEAAFIPTTSFGMDSNDDAEDYDEYQGLDDMGANEATTSEGNHAEIVYDASEYRHSKGQHGHSSSSSGFDSSQDSDTS